MTRFICPCCDTFTGKYWWQPEEAGRGSHNKFSPPYSIKCHFFPGWLTQPSSWKEQTFKTLWHVSETLPLSQCRWCSLNWQQQSRWSWLGDVASLVSVTSHPRHGLVSNSSTNINSIRREAQVQRVDICCHACVLRLSKGMHNCVSCVRDTGWELIKEWGKEQERAVTWRNVYAQFSRKFLLPQGCIVILVMSLVDKVLGREGNFFWDECNHLS